MGDAYDLAGSAYSSDKVINILHDYVKSNNPVSLEETSQLILDLLPTKSPLSGQIFGVGEDCFEVAEMSSYQESAHAKLTNLVETLGDSGYFSSVDPNTGKTYRFQRLGESMRENYSEPDEKNPAEYVNYHSFVAHLYERRIFPTSPSYAIWAMRDALEEDLTNKQTEIRSTYLLGAAQWILWNGQSLFELISQPDLQKSLTSGDKQGWQPGLLYHKEGVFNLERWQFWKHRFEEIVKEFDVTDECKEVTCRAVALMDSFERTMKF